MRTEQLRYLLLLEQHHSLTKIGNKLGVSYQTVDFGLRGLEQELGVPLVERSRNGLSLSVYGQAIKPYAETILENYEQVKRSVGADDSAITKLFLESSAIPHYVFLQDMCKRVNAVHTNVEIAVFRKSNKEVIDDIIGHQAMLGFITVHQLEAFSREHQQDDLILETLYEDRSYAALGRNHPLSQKRVLTPHMIKDYPISIYWEEYDPLAKHIMELAEQAAACFKTNDARAFEQSLLNDRNVGFITRSLAECHNFWDHKDKLTFCSLKTQTQPVIAAVYASSATAADEEVIKSFLAGVRAYL